MRSSHLDQGLSHPFFAPVLLTAAILAVYFPAIGNGFHTVDDPAIFAFFSSPPPLASILLPGHSYYYRPLVELSFYLDSRLWGMEPSIMHLENVLLHVTNTLFVYYIAKRAALHFQRCAASIPLFAALLFAIHPLNVEAVGWIAGRTDPLAAFFVLLTCWMWLCWLDGPRWWYGIAAPVSYGLALLTKETSLAFLPFFFLVVLVWPSLPARRRVIAVGGAVLTVVCAFVVATAVWKGNVVSFGRFLTRNGFDMARWLPEMLTSFGFYVKKLVIPLPLNFAITDVSPVYGVLGVMAVFLLVTLFLLCRESALFFGTSAFMMLPALAVTASRITWTPFAERYMYMPTAFLCLGTGCLLHSLQESHLNRLVPVILLVVCVAGGIDYQRNVLWRDKIAFYRDAIAKTPGFGSLYNELGGQYVIKGRFDDAAKAFATAERLNKRPSMVMPIRLNIMATKNATDGPVAARNYFYRLFTDKTLAPVGFLEVLYTADSKQLDTLAGEQKRKLAADLLDTLVLLNRKKPDPFWLYRSGQIAMQVGDTSSAASFFRRAYAAAPPDAHYKNAARTNYLRLETGQ